MNARLRPPRHLVDPRAIYMWTVSGLAGAVVKILFGVAVASTVAVARFGWVPVWVLDNVWWLFAAYATYALVRAVVIPQWRYRVHRWEVSDDLVYTRTGWLNMNWQLVPISRVQTVDHTRTWLERLFGLATVQIQTASHAGSSEITGLEEQLAGQIAEDIAGRAGELRDDAT
ncbi:PH domain-containing protein [Lipingzhangella sp. LS1_29]|uniref:PH domain-containing protein n=1 Tax=Lipingzhangella rawalii TaxID=2055835 RepID=A0ABU2H0I1_9ACTN|nr:PH domain-containing protein [Lipingzhangella rawalii]MDS1268816.1 PH domain-containing protein [Lipingzhangella rawalii]